MAAVAVWAGGEGAGPGPCAGIRPRSGICSSAPAEFGPAPRRRWELRLSLAEREEISRGLAAGESLRAIAAGWGRAPSTVSREITRNGGRGRYRALAADRAAWARAARPKQTKSARWPGGRRRS